MCITSGVCVPGASCFVRDWLLFVPLGWANALENAPMANSATATPARQNAEAVKMRRLKKADFDVDFFFITGSGVVSLSGEREMESKS